ncbi:MAG: lysophospholipid acyltransferase family protein [Chthoniobacterales bacterium]
MNWLALTRQVVVRYEGIDKLQNLRGTIVAANHPGLLDAVFLIGRLPRAFCIMRASLMRNIAVSGGARWAGYVTNDRGAGLIRQCKRKLEAGDNLLIFPEGTRTRAGARGVNAFKSGFALTSVRTGAPIHTVIIERSGAYLGKGTGLMEPAEIPIRMSIRVGRVFVPQPNEPPKELSRRLEDYFRAELEPGVGTWGLGERE